MNVTIQITCDKSIRLLCLGDPPEFFVIPVGFPETTRRESVTLTLSSPEDGLMYLIALRVGKIALREGAMNVILMVEHALASVAGPSLVVQADDVLLALEGRAQEVGDEQAQVEVACDLAGDGFLGIIPKQPTVLRDVAVAVLEGT